MKKFSFVIPCYNEEDNIPLILERISSMTDNFDDLEVILVDNGSKDNSSAVFSSLLADGKYPYIKLVEVKENKGYGFGILSGLKEATGQFLGWTHADMQTDPADLLKAYELIKTAKDPQNTFVKGVRKKRSFLDVFFTFGMTILSSLALRCWLSDVNAQPKVFSRKFYEEFDSPPFDFSLDLYVLYLSKVKGCVQLSMPVFFAKRLHGEAKGGGSLKTKWPLIKRTFEYIFKLRRELKTR